MRSQSSTAQVVPRNRVPCESRHSHDFAHGQVGPRQELVHLQIHAVHCVRNRTDGLQCFERLRRVQAHSGTRD
jgi:hypothetical protein